MQDLDRTNILEHQSGTTQEKCEFLTIHQWLQLQQITRPKFCIFEGIVIPHATIHMVPTS